MGKCIVFVLKNGYSVYNSDTNTMKAGCSCTVIRDGKYIIIVDPLSAWDKKFLVAELRNICVPHELTTHVVATHGHSDHLGNLNLFDNAKHIVGRGICTKDEYELFDFEEAYKQLPNSSYRISDNVEVIATGGHTSECVSVVARNADCFGTVVVCGDLFEKKEDLLDSTIWEELSLDKDLQLKNRNYVLSIADYIVPGHGPGFFVKKDQT